MRKQWAGTKSGRKSNDWYRQKIRGKSNNWYRQKITPGAANKAGSVPNQSEA